MLFIIAGEQCDRGDPVNNKVARIRVRALFTGLLRFTRNDKGVCLARDDKREMTNMMKCILPGSWGQNAPQDDRRV